MAKLLIWLKRLWHSVYRPDKVMYIGGSDTLPPPLPRDEESVLLEKLNTGDFQVRQTLIEHNLRLVVYIARRFENTGIHIEDLISIGTIGLIKAVNTFRTDKNIKLATYGLYSTLTYLLSKARKPHEYLHFAFLIGKFNASFSVILTVTEPGHIISHNSLNEL